MLVALECDALSAGRTRPLEALGRFLQILFETGVGDEFRRPWDELCMELDGLEYDAERGGPAFAPDRCVQKLADAWRARPRGWWDAVRARLTPER